MDGIAAAGELTAASPPAPAGRATSPARAFVIEVATPPGRGLKTPAHGFENDDAIHHDVDDEAIRRLLRESVFPGEISLSLEREPDSFAAAAIEGDVHETLVARERESGRVVATAGRSVRDAYVNGRPTRLGYLGQLRIDPGFRRRSVLDAGFAMCRTLHERGDARVYLLSVVADNTPARRMLERHRPGWPAVDAVDRFVTLAISVGRAASRQTPGDVQIVPGTVAGLQAIVECLQRGNTRYQFAPYWTVQDLESPRRTRDLQLDDFVVAIRDGSVVGCIACWDQRAFKQVVVRGYSARLALCRPAVNLIARWTAAPRLPAAGSRLEFAYLSHLAVDEDDAEVFEALVIEGSRLGRQKGVDYVAAGLPARSALLAHAQRSFGHRAYESMLYAAFWPDGAPLVSALDGRPSNPELAIL